MHVYWRVYPWERQLSCFLVRTHILHSNVGMDAQCGEKVNILFGQLVGIEGKVVPLTGSV